MAFIAQIVAGRGRVEPVELGTAKAESAIEAEGVEPVAAMGPST